LNFIHITSGVLIRLQKAQWRWASNGGFFKNELSKTEAAQKAREKRKKGGRKVIQKGGIIYVGDARMMVRTREEKAKKEAERKAELARQREEKKAAKVVKIAQNRSSG
jgi:hypothetical protein